MWRCVVSCAVPIGLTKLRPSRAPCSFPFPWPAVRKHTQNPCAKWCGWPDSSCKHRQASSMPGCSLNSWLITCMASGFALSMTNSSLLASTWVSKWAVFKTSIKTEWKLFILARNPCAILARPQWELARGQFFKRSLRDLARRWSPEFSCTFACAM